MWLWRLCVITRGNSEQEKEVGRGRERPGPSFSMWKTTTQVIVGRVIVVAITPVQPSQTEVGCSSP
jgi:hypothetical protein